jgi:hypothetical protein
VKALRNPYGRTRLCGKSCQAEQKQDFTAVFHLIPLENCFEYTYPVGSPQSGSGAGLDQRRISDAMILHVLWQVILVGAIDTATVTIGAGNFNRQNCVFYRSVTS